MTTTTLDRAIEQMAGEGADASEIAIRLQMAVDQVQSRARAAGVVIHKATRADNLRRRLSLFGD